MIYYVLYLEAKFCPEIVERILRVIRHRGFVLCKLSMFPYNNDILSNKIYVYMTIVSKRSVKVLCEHLNKLIDVVFVVVQDSNQNYNSLDNKNILCHFKN